MASSGGVGVPQKGCWRRWSWGVASSGAAAAGFRGFAEEVLLPQVFGWTRGNEERSAERCWRRRLLGVPQKRCWRRRFWGVVSKGTVAAGFRVQATERGTFFGYHRLVTDFIGLGDLQEIASDFSAPVCFDATHSTQLPGGGGETSAGRPERAPLLARAAVAAGVDAVFLETHPEPAAARSDRATVLPLTTIPELLRSLTAIRTAIRPTIEC